MLIKLTKGINFINMKVFSCRFNVLTTWIHNFLMKGNRRKTATRVLAKLNTAVNFINILLFLYNVVAHILSAFEACVCILCVEF